MRVFISWSGERSKAVGEAIRHWVHCVIQATDLWMSSYDLGRGVLWVNELNEQLRDGAFGIVCLTRENQLAPWIQFEAGALAKGLTQSRVCPLLVDLTPTDVVPPLSMFQSAPLNQAGVSHLARSINAALGERRLGDDVLGSALDVYWPQLDAAIQSAKKVHPASKEPSPRKEGDILQEILATNRSISQRISALERDGTRLEHSRVAARPISSADLERAVPFARKWVESQRDRSEVIREMVEAGDFTPMTALTALDFAIQYLVGVGKLQAK